jgi:hypothetical protein
MTMPTMSLRARLTVWYTLALVIALCLFAGYVLYGQRRLGLARLDRQLDSLSATVANVIRGELLEHASPTNAVGEARRAVTLAGSTFAVLDADGAPIGAGWDDLQLGAPLPPATAGRMEWGNAARRVARPRGAADLRPCQADRGRRQLVERRAPRAA